MGFMQKLRGKLTGSEKRRLQRTAWPLQKECVAPHMADQLQSPLFDKLMPELRLQVYRLALGDPDRFLHICLNSYTQHKKPGRPVAHWRCTDSESPLPTWQHTCFGEERDLQPERWDLVAVRSVTTTNDQLNALLRTCGRVYSEALAILYQENVFHFRGGLSLPAFKCSIPSLQWHAVRHVHLSTSYSAFYDKNFYFTGPNAPRSLPNWDNICKSLGELSNLQDLRFDIVANDPNVGYDYRQNEAEILLSILQPLKGIRAALIEVELNVEIPEDVWRILGPVKFTTMFRERPFNKELFRELLPMYDAMEYLMPDPNRRCI